MAGLGQVLGLLTPPQTRVLSTMTLKLLDDIEHRYAHLSKLYQANNWVKEQGFTVGLFLFLCLCFFLSLKSGII